MEPFYYNISSIFLTFEHQTILSSQSSQQYKTGARSEPEGKLWLIKVCKCALLNSEPFKYSYGRAP